MLLVCTESLKGYGLNRIFELAKTAGYDGVDLSINFKEFDTVNGDYLAKLSKEYDMPVHCISGPKNISQTKIKDLVKLAKKLNSKVLVLQPPKILNMKMASWLKKEVPKLREKEFLSIAMENASGETFLGFIPKHALSNAKELKEFKHISMDTARIGENKKDIMRAYSSFKNYLVHIHLSNVKRGKKYSLPDDGIMPLESFLTKLKQDRYPGAISIKILPKHLKAGNDDKAIDQLKSVKKYLDKYYTNVEAGKEEKK
jgi:sugar phosphate isomerase/epimerase